MKQLVNGFDMPGKWYKANLHTHTTVSDGRAEPAQRVEQYAKAGYDVLALTDHHATNDISKLKSKRMLIVNGIEYHPPCLTATCRSYHLVGLGLPQGFSFGPKEALNANRCIAKVKRAGGLSFLAHPYWCGLAFEDFKDLNSLEGCEVYNATCDKPARACSENEWAYAMDHGTILPALAVDDAHGAEGRDVCKAWTYLKMKRLTTTGVLDAIRSGACYASTGPKIHDFGVRAGKLYCRCSPAVKIQFMWGPPHGDTRQAEEGRTITSFSMDVPPKWTYARAVVTDGKGMRAWTSPMPL